jgi:hypothetical protein
MHIIISPTVGVFQAKIDGNLVVNQVGINTGSTSMGQLELRSLSQASPGHVYDNLWVFNTLGTHSNCWPIGPMTVQARYPLSTGTYNQWTPDFGSTHYSMVNNPQPDDDTTYIYDTDPGDRDSYGIQGLTGYPSQVHGIRAAAVLRDDNAAVGKAGRTFVLSGGNIVESANIPLSTSYTSGGTHISDDPATGAQWTVSGLNAIEVGIKTQI